MASAVRSPSGRIVVHANGQAWRIHIDGKLVATGTDVEPHVAALVILAGRYESDAELHAELEAAVGYWTTDTTSHGMVGERGDGEGGGARAGACEGDVRRGLDGRRRGHCG